MFGRIRQKKPSAGDQDSGNVIQGFVCPMCLSSFSTSNDLEVHFSTIHDKPQIQDDEMVLLRQQLSAAVQTRELMQEEISRHMKTITQLENVVQSMTAERNNSEEQLQKMMTSLTKAENMLDNEKRHHRETFESKNAVEVKLKDISDLLSSGPSPDYVEQLECRCEAAEKLVNAVQIEVERVTSERITEVAKLQENLTNVQASYHSFMKSLSQLIENIDSYEETPNQSDPDMVSVLGSISAELRQKEDYKNQLTEALKNHDESREKFKEEKRRLQEQLDNVEKMRLSSKSKLLELTEYVTGYGSESSISLSNSDDFTLLDAIHCSFDSLKDKTEQLQADIERNVSDEDVIKRLKTEYETLVSDKVHEISMLRDELSSAKKQVNVLEPASEELKRTISDLENQSNALLSENSKLKLDIQEKRKLLQILLERFGLQETITEEEFASFLDSFINEKHNFEIGCTGFKTELEKQKESFSILENQNTSLIQEFSVLEENTEQFKNKIKDLEVKLQEKTSENEDRLSLVRDLEHKLADIQRRYEAAESSCEETSEVLEKVKTERDLLLSEKNDIESEKKKLDHSVNEWKSEAGKRLNEIETLSANLGVTKSRNDELASENNKLKQQLLDATNRIADVTEESEKISSDSQLKSEQLAQQERKITELEQSQQRLSGALEKSEQRATELDNQLQNAAHEMDVHKSEYSKEIEEAKVKVEELNINVSKEKLITSELKAEVRLSHDSKAKLEVLNNQLSIQLKQASDGATSLESQVEKLTGDLNQEKAERQLDASRFKEQSEQILFAREADIRSQFSANETRLRGEMASLLARLEGAQQENQDLEDENQDLQRKIKEMSIALQELGREQQNLQLQSTRIKERRWKDDSEATSCESCKKSFSIALRRHHCRNCGLVFCHGCSSNTASIGVTRKPVRVCDACHSELN